VKGFLKTNLHGCFLMGEIARNQEKHRNIKSINESRHAIRKAVPPYNG
jgi:hypothetical protein